LLIRKEKKKNENKRKLKRLLKKVKEDIEGHRSKNHLHLQ